MYKIYCLNNISPEGLALLTDNYEVTENIDEADAILVRSADMHEMEVPANLKAVARAGAGVNNIPLDKFAEAGIAVFNTPGANANAVKELVLAGMLLASRDIIGGVAWVRDNADDENVGKAAEKAKKQFAGGEILGKTLGVIGLGAIGKLVAQSAEALGMKVIGYDPAMDEITVHEQISPTVEFADLPKVLKESDFITIHVPALPATKGMINADAIAQMKDGVVFLNFSRDVLVDDVAMAEALDVRQGGRVRDRLRQPGRREDGARHRHPASGRLHRRGRGQLRQDGRRGSHGLPRARREDPLREYVATR